MPKKTTLGVCGPTSPAYMQLSAVQACQLVPGSATNSALQPNNSTALSSDLGFSGPTNIRLGCIPLWPGLQVLDLLGLHLGLFG